jgi:hypothetical protein
VYSQLRGADLGVFAAHAQGGLAGLGHSRKRDGTSPSSPCDAEEGCA